MSLTKASRRRSGPPALAVPDVEDGDLGLVLTVLCVEWDGGYRRWSLIAANGTRYILPRELHEWARRVDTEIRRQLVRLPGVFAFSRQSGGTAARILTRAETAAGERAQWN